MKKAILVALIIIGAVAFLSFGTSRVIKDIRFKIDCTQHLKRAADANTIEIAEKELKIVLDYLEERELTSGIVSIFLKQPKNDIGFWYGNIKASYEELLTVNPDATQLEKSNVLMKLRETLVDDGEEMTVTHPNGISVYPNNVLYFWWGLISFFFTLILSIVVGWIWWDL